MPNSRLSNPAIPTHTRGPITLKMLHHYFKLLNWLSAHKQNFPCTLLSYKYRMVNQETGFTLFRTLNPPWLARRVVQMS